MKILKNKKTPAEIFYSAFLGTAAFWGGKFSLLTPPKKKTIILCYHSVSDNGWRFAVPPDNFYRQMKYIKDTIGAIALEDALKGESGGAAVTFDDGYADILENALPILEELEIKPALFAIGEGGKADRRELGNNNRLLADDQIAMLCRKGWSIGYHTKTHSDLRRADKEKIRGEIIGGKKDLEKKLGIKIDYFAYPRGIYSEAIIKSAKEAGFQAAFTVDGGCASKKDLYRIARVSVEGNIGMEEFKAMLSPIGLRFTSFYSKSLKIKESLQSNLNKQK